MGARPRRLFFGARIRTTPPTGKWDRLDPEMNAGDEARTMKYIEICHIFVTTFQKRISP
jgi:hypothetical protein